MTPGSIPACLRRSGCESQPCSRLDQVQPGHFHHKALVFHRFARPGFSGSALSVFPRPHGVGWVLGHHGEFHARVDGLGGEDRAWPLIGILPLNFIHPTGGLSLGLVDRSPGHRPYAAPVRIGGTRNPTRVVASGPTLQEPLAPEGSYVGRRRGPPPSIGLCARLLLLSHRSGAAALALVTRPEMRAVRASGEGGG
ncbi:hypothetical protein NL676_007128 [Syzygium grande]|nr:hypothetical protein NL676_007128 [Syzygium grande]